jgi:hypothetical protein
VAQAFSSAAHLVRRNLLFVLSPSYRRIRQRLEMIEQLP